MKKKMAASPSSPTPKDESAAVAVRRLQSAALTATANAIVIADRDGTIEWANPAFTAMTGYSLAEAVGKNPRDLVKSGRQERALYEKLWETILAGRVWHGELVNRRKDGSLYPEEQTITPVRNSSGVITHFIAIKQDLTERKQAEEALQASVERYRLLFERTPDVIFTLASTGIITALNPAFKTIAGWPPAEWIGQHFQGLLHPDDRARVVGLFQAVVRGEHIPRLELRLRTAASGYRSMEFTGFSTLLGKGEMQIYAIGRDLTERKRADAALAHSFSMLQATFESTADGLLVVDLAGRVAQFNRKFAEMWSIPADILASRDDNQMIDFVLDQLEDPDRFVAKVKELYAQPEAVSFDELKFKDGRVFERFSQPQNLGGRCVGRVWSFRDVTARKLAESQRREQSEILFNSHEGVVIVDLTNRVTLWNRGAEKIFGWPAAEALGRTPEQLLGLADPDLLSTPRAAVEREGFWDGELPAQTRDGRKLVVDCRTTLVCDEAGRPRARLNLLADITEKKRAEEQLLHTQRLESLGMLAAGIAHDLNNMLAPILFAAPMLRGSLSAPRDLRILDVLEQGASHGAGLVKQILGFAQNTAGDTRPTQVKHLARDIISLIEQTFPKSIELRQHIPSDLWPVQGNATQIHQVLLNLCVNARDAMPQGGTLGIVAANRRLDAAEAGAIPGARPGNWLALEVTDTGSGIPPEIVERIWEPFFTTKPPGKGTGLGLSTVRGIVANHHGFIELHSAVGRGTTVRVFLPALEGETPRQDTTLPFNTSDGHGELIVVVDDDAPIRQLIAEVLGTHGYRIVGCVDGMEALAYFQLHANEVSLVITDVDMPRLGGLALAHALLLICPELKVLAISGLASTAVADSSVPEVRKLAHAFLPKPFKYDELLATVHHLLHPPPARPAPAESGG